MTAHYTPASSGGWLALCSGSRLVVLGEKVEQPMLDTLWGAIADSGGFQATLDALTSRGLTATPPFVLLDAEGTDLRAVLRGEVSATVQDAAGEQELSGAGVSTWLERSLPGATSTRVVVTGAEPVTEAGSLPLRDGAAWISSLDFVADGVVVTRPQPVRAAAVAETPAPEPAPEKPAAEEKPAESHTIDLPPAAPAAVTPPAPPAPTPATVVDVDPEATVTEAPGAVAAEDYEQLFGDTLFRPVVAAPAQAPASAEAELAGDHDGHTVMTADIAKLRGGRKSKTAAAAARPEAPAEPQIVVAVSTGAREILGQPILVGRSPSVSKVSGDQIPRLITVGGADQDISRNHARIALEGGTVVVTDLHSRNGTMIVLPGKEPQKLRAGEPTAVILGTVVDLGGGVTLTVDEA